MNASAPATPRRIAIVYWGRRGAGSILTLTLAKRAAARLMIDRVSVFVRDTNEDASAFRESGLNVRFVGLPSLRALPLCWPRLLATLNRVAAEIAETRPDVVVFTMNFPFAWPLVHYLQARRLHVAYWVHDATPHPGDYARLWQATTQKLLLRSVDRIVALSSHVAGLLRANPRLAGRVAFMPLEALGEARPSPTRMVAPGSPLRLLFLGRLLRYKGLDLLRRALQPLRDDPRWTLTIAGDGPIADETRTLFSDLPAATIEIGWLARARFDELLDTHHLLVCPYVEASQSGVVMDAIACGMPVLVLPVGALPEQIEGERAGFVTGDASAQALTAAIRGLLDDPARIEAASRGAAALYAERVRFDVLSALAVPSSPAAD